MIAICTTCDVREKPCTKGECRCVDGVPIVYHVEKKYCAHPKGPKFGTGERPCDWPKPGEPIPERPAPKPRGPLPRSEWPDWALAIACDADENDIGVGDTIHRKLDVGGLAAKAALAALGVPCGCDERRDEFNLLFPYRPSKAA